MVTCNSILPEGLALESDGGVFSDRNIFILPTTLCSGSALLSSYSLALLALPSCIKTKNGWCHSFTITNKKIKMFMP